MEIINTIFGTGRELTLAQMSARAFVMFFISLILIRGCGMRTYAKKSAFDLIVIFVLGAVLSRGIVGASPFFHVVAASAVLVLLHALVAWITVKSKTFELLIKGTRVCLLKDGVTIKANMQKCNISENDLMESLILETNTNELINVSEAWLEVSGRISFLLKNN